MDTTARTAGKGRKCRGRTWRTRLTLALSCRIRPHRAQDALGEGGHHLLCHPRHSAHAALPLQHRRHHGPFLQVPLLEGLLLHVHQEAEEASQPEGQERAGHRPLFQVGFGARALPGTSPTFPFSSRCSGSRSLGRSRQQSFKHPGTRTSTRSADSALGLSESMIRSSYSDTECR